MKLLIVESPKKAKTIGGYLGDEWQVQASVGHFRDLPSQPKNGGMGVDLDTYKPEYEIQNKKVVQRLRGAARKADTVMLATDPDREGEAIAHHLSVVLGLNNPKRVTYQEITPDAVRSAIASPRPLDQQLVAAQEARRVLDRLIGYSASPRLGRGQSAGRVQSPALRLVVEREREILNFQPTNHFAVCAYDHQARFKAWWDTGQILHEDQKYMTDQTVADHVATATQLKVLETGKKQRRRNPPAPFTTSTMQQAASSQLKLRPDDTMKAAQALYEAGAITYLRTDSPHIAEEAQGAIREYLASVGKAIPDKPPVYKAKGEAQEAHECLRPTDITLKITGNTDAERQLYRLIRLRTLASQMTPAVYDVTTASFQSNVTLPEHTLKPDAAALFYAKGETLIESGWLDAIKTDDDAGDATDNDDNDEQTGNPLPPMNQGDVIDVTCQRVNKTTKPPARYTEATLTKALESRGIGRPSTYATVISGISKRKYVQIKQRKLYATESGCALVDALVEADMSFIGYDYTSELESKLDDIAAGQQEYFGVIDRSYQRLTRELVNLKPTGADAPNPDAPCPSCGQPMRRIDGQHGYFWGCSGYPDCKQTLPDDDGQPGEKIQASEPDPSAPCPECGQPMRRIAGSKGYFWGCSAYPKCKTTLPDDDGKPGEPAAPKNQGAQTDLECEQCGSPMLKRTVKKGPKQGMFFYGCSNFPKCKNTIWPE